MYSTKVMQGQLQILLLLLVLWTVNGAAEIKFVKPPVNASTLLGETAVFSCQATASAVIDFYINGTLQAGHPEVIQLGFTQTNVISIADGSIYRNLSVLTSSKNNNTFVICRAVSFEILDVEISDPAHLFVHKVSILEPAVYADNNTFPIQVTQVGQHSTFTCVARAKTVGFLLNGISAAYQSSHDKGFVQSSISFVNETIILVTISVTSSMENNNTYITCRAINSVSSEETDVVVRNVKLLVVQGSGNFSSNSTKLLTDANLSNITNTTGEVKIVLPPMPVTVTLGENGTFFCTVQAENMFFEVDETPEIYESIREKGFHMSFPIKNGTFLSSTLLAVGKKSNNNSRIKCVAYTVVGNEVDYFKESQEVYFRVQGDLAIANLQVNWINALSANVSWDPPFTLPGTLIIGYNISFLDNKTVVYDTFTTEHYYIWNTSCTRVTVSAYNGLDGNTSSRLIAVPPILTLGRIINIANEMVNISLSINISASSCWVDQFMSFVKVNISFMNHTGTYFNVFDEIPLLDLTKNILTSNTVIVLDPNEEYNVTVRFTEIMNNNYFEDVKINNFKPDVLLTVTSHESGVDALEFECEFRGSSDTKGCLIQLSSKFDSSITFSNSTNKTIVTDNKRLVAIVWIDDKIMDGEYILKGYIIETTGSPVLAFADYHYEIVVPASSMPNPSGSPSYSPTPTSDDRDAILVPAVLIACGGIIAVVIAIVVTSVICCVLRYKWPAKILNSPDTNTIS